jgi:tungstate transport system ATP-binding protein
MLDRPQHIRPSVASQTAGETLIALEGVGVSAGGTVILDRVTLGIAAGGPLVLVGPNGAGKSTLLKVAMGLLAPSSGLVRESDSGTPRAPRKAFVFQKPVMLRRSAAENISFALRAAGRGPTRGTVDGLLTRVGLGQVAARPARHLSGGEQQRLALARALACDPDILFLDEPTASLDPQATLAVEEIIAEAAADGVKIVMATHDLGEARRLGAEIALLVAGRLVEWTGTARFFTAPQTDTARRFVAGDLVL